MKMSLKMAARIAALLAFATAGGVAREAAAVASSDTMSPCQVKQKVAPVYPVRLMYDGILHGEALVVIEVNALGKLNDLLVVAYTHEAFAESAVDALKRWEFKAATYRGQSYGSRIDVTFAFEVTGVVVYEKKPMDTASRFFEDERFVYRPYRQSELDEPVRALHQTSPVYLRDWIREGRQGTVMIEFFIDEKGAVRLPAPTELGDEWLAAAAIAAVKEWRFTPPRRRGAPVLVRAQQPFVFQRPAVATQ